MLPKILVSVELSWAPFDWTLLESLLLPGASPSDPEVLPIQPRFCHLTALGLPCRAFAGATDTFVAIGFFAPALC